MQREHRTREKERGRAVREELRIMRENGVSSFEEIDVKRKEYITEVEEMKRKSEVREWKE